MVKHYIKLDLSKRDERKIIPVSKSDTNTHKIIFTLTNGSEPIILPADVDAWVNVRNTASPIEKAVVNHADNTIEYTPSSDAFTTTGFVVSVLKISDTANRTLFSPTFYLYVEDIGCDITTVFNEAATEAAAGANITAIMNNALGVLGAAGDNVQKHSENAEAWATGAVDGKSVDETKEQYNNNAKYYAEQSSSAANASKASSDQAQGFAKSSQSSAAAASSAAQAASEAEEKTIAMSQRLENLNPSSISVKLDPTSQALTFMLLNSKGESISSQTVDLPLEKCVKDVFDVNHKEQIEKIDINTKRITNLESRLPIGAFVEDCTVAYKKTVPTNACPYAQVNKIGGMTYKCNNLLPYPYYHPKNNDRDHYSKGITFTDNGDGSITLNGKNDGSKQSTFYIAHIDKNPLHLKAGHYSRYPITKDTSIAMSITDGTTYYPDNFALGTDKDVSVYLRIAAGDTTVFNNVTIYPMLNKGDTVLPWEQYWEGTKDTKVTALESAGRNLINPEGCDVTKFGGYKNLSISHNEDGALIINGRMNEGPSYTGSATKTISVFDLPAGTYTLSIKNTTGKGLASFEIHRSGATDKYLIGTVTVDEPTLTFEWTNEDIKQYHSIELHLTLYGIAYTQGIPSSSTRYPYEDYTIYFMLNEGTTALPYSPYGTIDNFPIAEEIQAIEGYGQSNPDNPNEYNYIDFDGIFVGKGHVVDGKWVAYGEPKKIDISEYLPSDSFIEVVGGGTITAVNEFEQAVPSTITYLTETAGE